MSSIPDTLEEAYAIAKKALQFGIRSGAPDQLAVIVEIRFGAIDAEQAALPQ